jgi:hypothetical protein
MSSIEIKNEIKKLTKIGLPEDMALLVAAAKYNKPELAEEVMENSMEEQQQIIKEMTHMKPMEIVDTTGSITPILPHNIFYVVDDIYQIKKPLEIEGGTTAQCSTIENDSGIKIFYEEISTEISNDNVNDKN